MSPSPFLFVAIDNNSYPEAYSTALELSKVEGDFGFKINLDLILLHGVSMLTHFKSLGKPVFADIKMWNGTRTMKDVLKALDRYGIDYTNVYAFAGEDYLKELVQSTSVKILALTVMTHYDDSYYDLMFGGRMYKFNSKLSNIALRAGCHGVILPPGCISEEIGAAPIKKVCPAIRPTWYKDSRHSDAVEPKRAMELGADMLVCGSPITKAKDKKEALAKILNEIGGGG